MSYKVFLSYSWSNSAERRALQLEIRGIKSVEMLVDATEIQPGNSIHKCISQLIDLADFIVVLLTLDGLQSREVLDEISRCHDRGKFIIPVVAEGTTLESLPWYIRDLHWIKYNNRNFDEVAQTIISAISSRANPFDDARVNIPPELKDLVDAGTQYIDIPVPTYYGEDSIRTDYVYCALRMRKTGHCFVFRAAKAMEIGVAAKYLANELLPRISRESYDWTFIYRDDTILPAYHTFQTTNIKSGDTVYLHGHNRLPEILPR